MIRRNPSTVSDSEIINLYEKASSTKKSEKADARRAAQKLRLALSDNSGYYWTITKKYSNVRRPDVDLVIQRAISLDTKRNPTSVSKKITKRSSKKSNPVRILDRVGEVTLKYKGNKIIFDGKDANHILGIVREEFSDNDELQSVLG